MTLALLLILAGIVFLYLGGEALVKGAAHLAINLGIPPLVVGLTVVSFSTSMPEMVSSLFAVFQGEEAGDLALGNVLGSNIANIGLILGVTALISPLEGIGGGIRRETVIMVGVAGLLCLLLLTGSPISRLEGALLFSLILGYVAYQVYMAKGKSSPGAPVEKFLQPETFRREPVSKELGLIAVGIACLVLGGYGLVEGALRLGRLVGLSERVLGLTVVAVGTSLPELATSLVAAVRKHSEMSIGNIVGSNVFNICSVVGAVAMIKPIAFGSQMVHVDTWIMLAFCLMLLASVVRVPSIQRWEGVLMLLAYLGYCAYLFI